MATANPNPSGLCMCGCGQRTAVVEKSCASRGLVRGQHRRFISGHNGFKDEPQYDVRNGGYETPCWFWAWGRHRKGYGLADHDGRKVLAHRLFYEREHGSIPEGLELDHLCRNRACVNPAHLEPVTRAENARRGAGTKLTIEDVRAIRASTESSRVAASRFGVSPTHIRTVRLRRAWAEVA